MFKRVLDAFRRVIGRQLAPSAKAVEPPTTWNDILGESSVEQIVRLTYSKYTMIHPKNVVLVWREDGVNFSSRKRRLPPCARLLLEYTYEGVAYELTSKRPLEEPFAETCNKMAKKMASTVSMDLGRGPKTANAEFQELEKKFGFDAAPEEQYETTLMRRQPLDRVLLSVSGVQHLMINGERYRVIRDPTQITAITCKLLPIVGQLLMPVVECNESGRVKDLKLHWYVRNVRDEKPEVDEDKLEDNEKSKATESGSKPKAKKKKKKHNCEKLGVTLVDEEARRFAVEGFTYRSTGVAFEPTAADVDRRIAVVADIGPESTAIAVASDSWVVEGPSWVVSDEQVAWCRANPIVGSSVRLMTYNLLAGLYLNLDMKQEELFFWYCPKDYQSHCWRYPIIFKQLTELKSSIVFMQEVDHRMQLYYAPALFKQLNCGFNFVKKRLQVSEGEAIAWNNARFELVSASDFGVAELAADEEENADVRRVLATSEATDKIMKSRPTVVQVVVLRDLMEKKLIVCANTHLHHSPKDEQIKAMQALVAARKLFSLLRSVADENPASDVRLLFAGDFNSTPSGAVCELLNTGRLDKTHECWSCDPNLVPEDFELPEALECVSGNPDYTNYTMVDGKGFVGCLDYVWAKGVTSERVCVMPAHEKVTEHGAIPSMNAPSDHLPVICDVRFH